MPTAPDFGVRPFIAALAVGALEAGRSVNQRNSLRSRRPAVSRLQRFIFISRRAHSDVVCLRKRTGVVDAIAAHGVGKGKCLTGVRFAAKMPLVMMRVMPPELPP